MIQIKKYDELSNAIKHKLTSIIQIEFGHIPIVQETEWAKPDWTILKYEKDQILSFYNIVIRNLLIDNRSYKAAGINNVITPKEHRGKGYASALLSETANFIFKDLNCEIGVLLCADQLISFYEKLSWYNIKCPVYFKQSTGKKIWQANCMFLSKKDKLVPFKVDLNGLPW